MNEEEKRQRLEEIRKAQEAFMKQEAEKKAHPANPNTPRIGAFAEDEPEIHQSMANKDRE